jgi:hypothetical protein
MLRLGMFKPVPIMDVSDGIELIFKNLNTLRTVRGDGEQIIRDL